MKIGSSFFQFNVHGRTDHATLMAIQPSMNKKWKTPASAILPRSLAFLANQVNCSQNYKY